MMKCIDEYTLEELKFEIFTRIMRKSKGNCDYCNRKPTSKPCRFLERHTNTDTINMNQPLWIFLGAE